MEKHVKQVLIYFSYFGYSPTLEQIHTFFPIRVSRQIIRRLITSLVHKKKLVSFPLPHLTPDIRQSISFYTLPQYGMTSNRIKNLEFRVKNTNRLLEKVKSYIKVLSLIPSVRMVGITGSASMGNCKKNDDVDLFVVTAKHTLWTARFACVVIAKAMGLYGNTVCLNLFFDESDLVIPRFKQTEYIAHELLQMKPVVNKNKTYEQIMHKNVWVQKIFPNFYSSKYHVVTRKQNKVKLHLLLTTYYFILSTINTFFRTVQLPLIRHNKTGFFISSSQLWLFRKDYELRLKNKEGDIIKKK